MPGRHSDLRVQLKLPHSTFRHSAFRIPHSAFGIPHLSVFLFTYAPVFVLPDFEYPENPTF